MTNSYTRTAIFLHWAIAFLIVLAVLVGLVMGEEDILPREARMAAFQFHKSLGFSVLGLLVMRLFWRFTHPVPELPAGMRPVEIKISKLIHALLYFLMFAVPFSGWAVVSSSPYGIPSVWFGLFEIPHLPILSSLENKAEISEGLGEVHETIAWGLIGFVLLHAAAAFKHHFIEKDDVLTRMIPILKPLKK